MSENSPPTPVNATIDLEQLQSLIAAQAQVNSTQEASLYPVIKCGTQLSEDYYSNDGNRR